MGVRLRTTYYSTEDRRYQLDIIDTESADTLIDFDMPPEAAIIEYKGDVNDPFKPLIPVTCTFQIELDSAELLSFYDDVKTAKEGRFLVRLYYASSNITYFNGVIISNLSEREDSPNPVYQVQAVCGLQLLKGKKYNFPARVPLTRYTWIEHIKEIIGAIPTTDFYNDLDALFEVATTWNDSKMDNGDFLLSKMRVKHMFFRIKQASNTRDPWNCYDVLLELVTAINARIRHIRGKWHIEQIGQTVQSLTDVYLHAKNGTNLLKQQINYLVNINSSSLVPYPVLSNLPPIKDAILTQKADFVANITYGIESNYLTPFNQIIYNILQENVDNADYLEFAFYIEQYLQTNDPDKITFPNVKGRLRFRLRVGTKYLTTAEPTGPDTYEDLFNQNYIHTVEDLSWTTNVNDYVDIQIPLYSNEVAGEGQTFTKIIIRTPAIPVAGEVSLQFIEDGLYQYDGSTAYFDPAWTEDYLWWIREPRMSLSANAEDSEDTDDVRELSITNDNDNRYTEEVELTIGDYTGTTLEQKIEILDNSGNWVDGGDWQDPNLPGAGTQVLEFLLLKERVAMRDVPQPTVDVTIDGVDVPLFHNQRIQYGDDEHIILRSVHYTGTSFQELFLWKVAKALPAGPIVITNNPTPINANVGNFSSGGSNTTNLVPSGTTSSNNLYQEWSGVNAAFVDVTVIDLPASINDTVKANLEIIVNGIIYKLVSSMGSGGSARRHVAIDKTGGNNRLVFFRAHSGADIEMRVTGPLPASTGTTA